MTDERPRRLSLHPIKQGRWARMAHAGDADDCGQIHLDDNKVPIHASKPTSNSEYVSKRKKRAQDSSTWGKEIITREDY